MNSLKLLLFGLVVFVFTGCLSYQPSIPVDYKGDIANIRDTSIIHSKQKIDFFYLEKINEDEIYNSRYNTLDKNYGNGFLMYPYMLDHDVPTRKAKFTIVGRTEYAAPILALTNTVYEIKGVIEFTPEKNKQYVVKGSLTENGSIVWIENVDDNKIVGNKIEVKGSTALGFFEK